MCDALSYGYRERQLYRVVLGQNATEIRGKRRDLTKRFKKISATIGGQRRKPVLANYEAAAFLCKIFTR